MKEFSTEKAKNNNPSDNTVKNKNTLKNKSISAKKVCFLGIFTAVSMAFAYVEILIPLDFIAPGIKIGLANILPLYLVCIDRKKEGFAVNVVRIILTSLLFTNAFALAFSLSAGIISLLTVCGFSKIKKIGTAGLGIIGGTVHNITQLTVATFTVGKAVWYYAPILIFFGVVTGILTGTLSGLIAKKEIK